MDADLERVRHGRTRTRSQNEGAPNSGAVYVFRHDGSHRWQQQAFLKPKIAVTGDGFGQHVAISSEGDVVAAVAAGRAAQAPGVHRNHLEGSESTPPEEPYGGGTAYVFTPAGGQWAHRAAAIPPVRGTVHAYNSALALSGDGATLALGAAGFSDAGPEDRVFVY